jgi:glycosyltransferase involved in cell wall biosynthesis
VKILQVCPTYYPHIGGVEAHVHDISRCLKEAGMEVEVYTTKPSIKKVTQEVIDGIEVTYFPAIAPAETIFFSYPLYRALKEAKADIVHAHNYRALPMLFTALTKRRETRLVVTTHLGFSKLGRWLYALYNPLFGRKIFDQADKIIIVSPAELEQVPILKEYSYKVVHIPNGVDFAEINRSYSAERKAGAEVNLLCASRVEKKKGVDAAIKTTVHLRELPVHLNIVGEGPYMSHLRSLADELNLREIVTFKGKVTKEELYSLYAQSDIFLLLSEYEAHSVALTEAMAFGLVPFVTGVGGNPYIVDEEIGYIFDYPADAGKVAATMKQLISDRDLLAKKARAARDKAAAEFNLDTTVERLMEVYKSVR